MDYTYTRVNQEHTKTGIHIISVMLCLCNFAITEMNKLSSSITVLSYIENGSAEPDSSTCCKRPEQPLRKSDTFLSTGVCKIVWMVVENSQILLLRKGETDFHGNEYVMHVFPCQKNVSILLF